MAFLTAFIAAGAAITVAWISHSAKISEFRQAWINGLRDDLATYFKDLEALYFWVDRLEDNTDGSKFDELEQKKRDSRRDLLFSYNRILLRLNMNEDLHKEMSEKLLTFFTVSRRVPDQEEVQKAIALSQRLLKREWVVTKQLPVPQTIKRFLCWRELMKHPCKN